MFQIVFNVRVSSSLVTSDWAGSLPIYNIAQSPHEWRQNGLHEQWALDDPARDGRRAQVLDDWRREKEGSARVLEQ